MSRKLGLINSKKRKHDQPVTEEGTVTISVTNKRRKRDGLSLSTMVVVIPEVYKIGKILYMHLYRK